ncbi:hypothetical protein [Sporomusa sphaeroides]
MIHQALQSALSVGNKQDYSLKRFDTPQTGDMVSFEVRKITRSFAYGVIDYYGKQYQAYIHIGQIADTYINDINEFLSEGERIQTVILEFDQKYAKWSVSRKFEKASKEVV